MANEDRRLLAQNDKPAPRVEITYCTRCKFLLRAAWLAQELLLTFEKELGEVALRPGSGGIFEVTADGEVIATNRAGEPMPDVAEVKRRLRDRPNARSGTSSARGATRSARGENRSPRKARRAFSSA